MKRLDNKGVEVPRRGNPVGETTYRNASSLDFLPVANKADPPRPLEPPEHHLRQEVQIRDEG